MIRLRTILSIRFITEFDGMGLIVLHSGIFQDIQKTHGDPVT